MIIFKNESLYFENRNGKTYEVKAYNEVSAVAILKDKNGFVGQQYLVARGFFPNHDSWGSGVYDLPYEKAKEEFDGFY